MEFIIDELKKSLKYHLRQLDENLNKIRTYEGTIEDLKYRNESHERAIKEIGGHIEQLEEDR
jgi:peptidoglycan hydrolase CwlO-like protein